MKRMGVVKASIALAALAAMALMGAVTAAGVVRVKSRVTVSRYEPFIHGKVVSREHRCEVRRKVRLLRAHNHRPVPDELVGRDRTNRKGRWRVHGGLTHGRYYARVRRRKRDGFACAADRSATRTYGATASP